MAVQNNSQTLLLNEMTIRRNQRKRNISGWCFLLPSFIGFTIFRFIPILSSFFLGFTDWNLVSGLPGIKFIGMENYAALATDSWFMDAFANTFVYVIITIPITIILSLLAAVIVNDKVYLRTPIRLMIYMPYISSIVAVSMVWLNLFSPSYGPINMFLKTFGIQNPPGWLQSSKYALLSIAIIGIWQTVGYYMIIFIAGLQNIPATYYEAAEIDGANVVQRFFKITLPVLSPTTFFVMITVVIQAFQIFTPIKIITQGGPGRATFVLVYYVYKLAVEYSKIGYANAVSVILFLFVLLITFIQLKLQKRWVFFD